MKRENQKYIIINDEEVLIDKECIDLVLYFNNAGLKTCMCCSGHGIQNFRIIFDDTIMDNDICNFLKEKVNKFNHSIFLGKFSKWTRIISGEIKQTWMYEAEKISFAQIDYKRLKEYE